MATLTPITKLLTDIADAVREKNKTTELINATDLPTVIGTIKTDPVVGPKTVTANGIYTASDDSLEGYDQFEVAIPVLEKLELGGISAKPSDFHLTAGGVVAGIYHRHTGAVPGPGIPSNPNGSLFTAETVSSCTVSFRTQKYVITENGEYNLLELSPDNLVDRVEINVPGPTFSSVVAEPEIYQQIITPSEGTNGLSSVTINAVTARIDPNIIPENIKSGISILGVTGNLTTGVDTSDATATAADISTGKTAYINGVKVTGTAAIYAGEVI